MTAPIEIEVASLGESADAVDVARSLDVGACPVLVLVGGASGMDDADVDRLTAHLTRFVVPAILQVGAAVLDGGTDAGVMRAIGRARRAARGQFPLIGVIAEGVAATAAEPNHTHIVVVPGRTWGDEVPWLGRIAAAVADNQPTATLLVNGGQIAYLDMAESLRNDRPVIVLAGSGRTADEVAAATFEDVEAPSTPAQSVAASHLTRIVPIDDGAQVAEALDRLLGAAIIPE